MIFATYTNVGAQTPFPTKNFRIEIPLEGRMHYFFTPYENVAQLIIDGVNVLTNSVERTKHATEK